jgi:glycosyltransferase involved in cell wall biosynthesis
MRVLLLHNRYQLAGGEDGVVQAEKSLLQANGHEVSLLQVSNDRIKNTWDKVATAINAIYSYSSKERVKQEIARLLPDVVHVHNFFPLLSPSIYDACREHKIPIVQTLHNYRLACPKAMPFRDGKICEDCIGELVPWQSIVHGCYRSSRVESSVVAVMNTWHRLGGTWQKKVDAYIVFTEFQKAKMVQAGLPAAKLHIKPNFVFDHVSANVSDQGSNYILFVGRLSPEKGVSVLIDAYVKHNLRTPLKIVGDGPLRQQLQQEVENTNTDHVIEFLGFQNQAIVLSLMRQAKLLVFPSIWYEGFPLTVAEAFACGLAVITPKLGCMAEIIEDGVNGCHFEPGNAADLAAKIQWADAFPDAVINMGINARCTYEVKYSPGVNYEQLIKIYQEVI